MLFMMIIHDENITLVSRYMLLFRLKIFVFYNNFTIIIIDKFRTYFVRIFQSEERKHSIHWLKIPMYNTYMALVFWNSSHL